MGKTFILVVVFAAAALARAESAEPHADGVIARVLENAAKIRAADPEAVPMAFWDFDGTVIKGDVSIGLVENGEVKFKGLIERTIESGLSSAYAKDGYAQFRDVDYPRLNQFGRWIAWPFLAQMFHGRSAAELDAFCAREAERVYRHWYFAASVKILQALEKAGVENYIVSASPEIFVRNMAGTLGLPRERMRAVRVEIDGGRMTTKVIHPIPAGEGKVENVRQIVLARPHGVAVAAFGNSYSTDGAFLRYVATQPSLPGGAKGTAMMINGNKTVPGYSEHFICVNQDAVVGESEGR